MFDRISEGRWWDIGLDLVTGCTPVSPGCAHCWSAEKAHRAGYQRNPKIKARYDGLTDVAGRWTGEVRPQWQDLDKIGRPRKPQVYTFWNDLFHPGVPVEFIDLVLDRIERRPEHFYIICTKRPERALEYFDTQAWKGNALYYRLMLMTSAENQEMADLRVPVLLQIPGVMHGLSVEPGLGMVDLLRYLIGKKALEIFRAHCGKDIDAIPDHLKPPPYLDWVICGGETGSHARPMHPDIPRKLRDDCHAAGVPFFFKSWGEWVSPYAQTGSFVNLKGKVEHIYEGGMGVDVVRVGKKAVGRLLDGRMWDEMPALLPMLEDKHEK